MSITAPKVAGFVSRESAGLVPPRSVSNNITPGDGGVVVHYGGSNVPTVSAADAKSTWRSWQHYHMQSHGWVDIAYTMGVDNWGFVYAGRGAGVRTAANGTNYANQHFYAVCWIGGAAQRPTAAALSAIAWAVQSLRGSGAGLAVKPHSHFRQTSCCGDPLRGAIVEIDNVELSQEEDAEVVLSDIPLIGRWVGRKTSVGVFRNSQFLLRKSLSAGDAEILFKYGRPGDVPVIGNWGGSDNDGIGIVRDGHWYLRDLPSAGPADVQFTFGAATDVPLVGDFTGGGRNTPVVFRDGKWFFRYAYTTGDAQDVTYFGRKGDVPIVGDWDGDGVDGIGVYRGNTFYLTNDRSSPEAEIVLTYGREGDVPLAGDWHNIGADSIGVRRGDTFHLRSTLHPDKTFPYGRA